MKPLEKLIEKLVAIFVEYDNEVRCERIRRSIQLKLEKKQPVFAKRGQPQLKAKINSK